VAGGGRHPTPWVIASEPVVLRRSCRGGRGVARTPRTARARPRRRQSASRPQAEAEQRDGREAEDVGERRAGASEASDAGLLLLREGTGCKLNSSTPTRMTAASALWGRGLLGRRELLANRSSRENRRGDGDPR
jgi:hypothetical protein